MNKGFVEISVGTVWQSSQKGIDMQLRLAFISNSFSEVDHLFSFIIRVDLVVKQVDE